MNNSEQNKSDKIPTLNLRFDKETNDILRGIAEKTGLKLVVIVSKALRLAKLKVEKGEIL